MVCNACGRKVDPDQSFCRACGSMVFIDETEGRWRHTHAVAHPSPPLDQRVDARATDQRVNVPAPPRGAPRRVTVQRPRPVSSPPALSLGCLGSLVRLAVFIAVVWYGGRWLLSIPEVRTLVDSFAAGSFSDAQIQAAIDAVRTHILQLLGIPSSSR